MYKHNNRNKSNNHSSLRHKMMQIWLCKV